METIMKPSSTMSSFLPHSLPLSGPSSSSSSTTATTTSKRSHMLTAASSAAALVPKPVRAILRIRPRLKHEKPTECVLLDPANPALVQFNDGIKWTEFKLDHCFPPSATQDQVFAMVQPMLDRSFDGISAAIFAYGMTSSGKTFTIEGNADHPGVVFRSAQYLFDQVPFVKQRAGVGQLELHLAMFEIYNEKIRNLLETSSPSSSSDTGLVGEIRTQLVAGTCAEYRQIQLRQVSEYDQFVAEYRKGLKCRSTGATNLNAQSSRSHLIVQFVVVSRTSLASGSVTYAKVNLVDLAGSEDNRKTGNTGARMKESQSINSSLFALDQVVTALNRGGNGHVPYKNSKLTTILKDSLGGSAQALIIANVGPSSEYARETKATLNFATKSVKIVNKPVSNTVVTAPPPPLPSLAPPPPSSRKRPVADVDINTADVDADAGRTGKSNKKRRMGVPPAALVELDAKINSMHSQLQSLVAAQAAAQGPSRGAPATPSRTAAAAPLLPPAAVHTPGTLHALATEHVRSARTHAARGDSKLAAAHYVEALKDPRLDPRVRQACLVELEACRGGAAGHANVAEPKRTVGAGVKVKRRIVMDASDDEDDAGSRGLVAGVDGDADMAQLTPRTRVLARARKLLEQVGSSASTSSALADPPLQFTLSDTSDDDDDDGKGDRGSSPIAKSKSSSGVRGKKPAGPKTSRGSGSAAADLTMTPHSKSVLLELVNSGDPDKIASTFDGVGKGKAKLIVDHAKGHGPIGSPKQLLGIFGIAQKTAMGMRDRARELAKEKARIAQVLGTTKEGATRTGEPEVGGRGGGTENAVVDTDNDVVLVKW